MARSPRQVALKNLDVFRDRTGRERHYYRIGKGPRVPLTGAPGTPEFLASYQAAAAAYPEPEAPRMRAKIGSFGHLALEYFKSARFLSKTPRTQYVERQVIERWLAVFGDMDVRRAQARHFDEVFAKMADRPGAAMDLRKRLRNLTRFAIKLGWRQTDPIAETDTFKGGTRHSWTEAEIAQFQAHWPRGTRQRTAFDLGLYLAQRRSDVCALTWGQVSDGVARLTQQKTGAAVAVPVHSELRETLAAAPKSHAVIIATEFGRPFSQAGFGNFMHDAIKAAGLPAHCSFHGLRKAAARRLAEAGATTHEIAAVTGHRTLKEVERYAAAVNNEALAAEAMRKVAARDGNKSPQTSFPNKEKA